MTKERFIVWKLFQLGLVLGALVFMLGPNAEQITTPAVLLRASALADGVPYSTVTTASAEDLLLLDCHGPAALEAARKWPEIGRLYDELGEMPQLETVSERHTHRTLRVPAHFLDHPLAWEECKRQLAHALQTLAGKVQKWPEKTERWFSREASSLESDPMATVASWPSRLLAAGGRGFSRVTTVVVDVAALAASSDATPAVPASEWLTRPYTSRERAILTLIRIDEDGHHYLRRFELPDNGGVIRIRSTELVAATEDFFFGSIQELEREYKLGHSVEPMTVAGAVLEAAMIGGIVAGAGKLAKAGYGARKAVARGTMKHGWKHAVLRGATWLPRKAFKLATNKKFLFVVGAIAIWNWPRETLGTVASVVNTALDFLADWLGRPRMLVRVLGWAILGLGTAVLFPTPFLLLFGVWKMGRRGWAAGNGLYKRLRSAMVTT
ncbi:MAG: hypothetical protein COV10_00205 [Candidatus Vogelbacteria bacterium CG10_big_fil_rev_8_21_14_0_10_51_16]|uniref:Uncharacterized protein n=1 Tax=Candidatus Vogelbacteria bacterium CG10_big_fil_rev_8_21_14_0_10_51_16 TaxID=1975045 RepID=A0A2H0RHP2_9BACT|nr:MAG: hypothetical protein COV10_00205 [Candidatus Vogelbacteria bacterium CG10_big_fil_rev_8_21_14_0_10_51_16]